MSAHVAAQDSEITAERGYPVSPVVTVAAEAGLDQNHVGIRPRRAVPVVGVPAFEVSGRYGRHLVFLSLFRRLPGVSVSNGGSSELARSALSSNVSGLTHANTGKLNGLRREE